MTPELLLQLVAVAGAGVGVYAAIRSDLVRALVVAEQAAKSADEAHGRIDRILAQ
jgi:hypothetical protein